MRHLLLLMLLAFGLLACTPPPSPPINTASVEASGTPSNEATATPDPSSSASTAPSESAAALPSASAGPATPKPSEVASSGACNTPLASGDYSFTTYYRDVRVGTHSGFDRVVFEFDSGLPEISVRLTEPPLYEDASGRELEVAGNTFFEVIFRGGTRAGPDGDSSYDGPTEFVPGFVQLVHLRSGGDFEAVSTWYIGTYDADCAYVFTLSDPDRVVIDFPH